MARLDQYAFLAVLGKRVIHPGGQRATDEAGAELVRVCRAGGCLATEFCWRRPPTPQAARCSSAGLQFDTVEEWTSLYETAGLTDIQVATGSFEMMTPRGFRADEGMGHALRVCAAALTPARLRTMAWLMPRMMRAVPYLGYVVIAGTKPAT